MKILPFTTCFDVMVRDYKNKGIWKFDVFSHIGKNGFVCIGGTFDVIAPFPLNPICRQYLGTGKTHPDEISFQYIGEYSIENIPKEE